MMIQTWIQDTKQILINHLRDIQYIILPKDEAGMDEPLAYLQANCEPSKAEYFVFR